VGTESHPQINIPKLSALSLLEDARLAAASRWRAQLTRPLFLGGVCNIRV